MGCSGEKDRKKMFSLSDCNDLHGATLHLLAQLEFKNEEWHSIAVSLIEMIQETSLVGLLVGSLWYSNWKHSKNVTYRSLFILNLWVCLVGFLLTPSRGPFQTIVNGALFFYSIFFSTPRVIIKYHSICEYSIKMKVNKHSSNIEHPMMTD